MYNQEPKLRVSIKSFPPTTGNIEVFPKYTNKFLSMIINNGHHHIINKTFRVPATIGETIKH